MSFRNYLRRMRETLTTNRPAASRRRRPCKLEFDWLEDRLALVVGAFANAATVATGTGFDGVVRLTPQGCTGSLLPTGRHILPAAHCLTDTNGVINVPNTTVNFQVPHSLIPGATITIQMTVPQADYRIHNNWDGRVGNGNDIAILRLPVLAPSG